MNPAGLSLVASITLLLAPAALGTIEVTGYRLPSGRDIYFVENNLVYRRFLELARNGTYRQINQDRTSCTEADQGTWTQAADGTVRLRSTHHALRFRALLGGPLSVVLDSQEKLHRLAALAAAIRGFLASTGDTVFGAKTISEFSTPPGLVALEPSAETYRRDDLQSLVRQIDDVVIAERTGTYTFTALKPAGSPPLVILQDAVFQPDDLPRVQRAYHVRTGAAPPFYFAQVDARVYAREVGTWQAFHYLGGTE